MGRHAATVEGVLTTDLGALEARGADRPDHRRDRDLPTGRSIPVAPARGSGRRAPWTAVPAHVASTARTSPCSASKLPTPLEVQTGAAAELLEGLRLQLGDRHGGAERAERRQPDDRRRLGRGARSSAGRAGWLRSGARVDVVLAAVGQRDSSGTASRVPPPRRRSGELELPPPTPSPRPPRRAVPSPTSNLPPTVGTATAAPSLSPAPRLAVGRPTIAQRRRRSPSRPRVSARWARRCRARRGRRRGRQARHAAVSPSPMQPAGSGQAARRRRAAGARHAARGPGALADPYGQVELRPAERRHRRRRTGTPPSAIAPSCRRRRRAPNEGRPARQRHHRRLGVQVDQQRPHLHHRTDGATLAFADASAA